MQETPYAIAEREAYAKRHVMLGKTDDRLLLTPHEAVSETDREKVDSPEFKTKQALRYIAGRRMQVARHLREITTVESTLQKPPSPKSRKVRAIEDINKWEVTGEGEKRKFDAEIVLLGGDTLKYEDRFALPEFSSSHMELYEPNQPSTPVIEMGIFGDTNKKYYDGASFTIDRVMGQDKDVAMTPEGITYKNPALVAWEAKLMRLNEVVANDPNVKTYRKNLHEADRKNYTEVESPLKDKESLDMLLQVLTDGEKERMWAEFNEHHLEKHVESINPKQKGAKLSPESMLEFTFLIDILPKIVDANRMEQIRYQHKYKKDVKREKDTDEMMASGSYLNAFRRSPLSADELRQEIQAANLTSMKKSKFPNELDPGTRPEQTVTMKHSALQRLLQEAERGLDVMSQELTNHKK